MGTKEIKINADKYIIGIGWQGRSGSYHGW